MTHLFTNKPEPKPEPTRPQSLFEELCTICDPMQARALVSIAEAQARREGGGL